MTPIDPPDYLLVENPEGAPWRIARRRRAGAGAGLVWLGGFASDMRGIKASHIDAHAAKTGRPLLRFDYSGHGESDGRFEEGCVSHWLEQTATVFRQSTQGPQIVLGASMGAWLALLLARRLAALEETDRLKALILLAPATDFTEALIWKSLTQAQRKVLMETGVHRAGPEAAPITKLLIEDGRKHLLLGDVVRVGAPVHILQGMSDDSTPWSHAQLLMERLVCDSAVISYIPGGDHRLSRPEDLEQLLDTIERAAAA